jgi:ribonuclease HIII
MKYEARYHKDRSERGAVSHGVAEPPAPKPRALITLSLTPAQIAKLGDILSRKLWVPFTVQYATFAYRDVDANVVAYNPKPGKETAKVVIAGKGAEAVVQNIIEPEVTGEARLGYDDVWHPEWFEPHAGLDESGKGDLFGPLVTACVITTDGDAVKKWLDLGVRDSKAVTSDAAVFALERQIRNTSGVFIKVICDTMEHYNARYTEFDSNVNKLLAHYHATGLLDVLAQIRAAGITPPARGLLDQFCKTPLTQRELKKGGEKTFDLAMRTKAESDPVVAAASIVARATFVRKLVQLSRLAGEVLPKGSGAPAKAAGEKIVAKLGAGAGVFGKFAKLHFKTACECRGLPPPPPKPFFRARHK